MLMPGLSLRTLSSVTAGTSDSLLASCSSFFFFSRSFLRSRYLGVVVLFWFIEHFGGQGRGGDTQFRHFLFCFSLLKVK